MSGAYGLLGGALRRTVEPLVEVAVCPARLFVRFHCSLTRNLGVQLLETQQDDAHRFAHAPPGDAPTQHAQLALLAG